MDKLDLLKDPAGIQVLLDALSNTQVAVCLCESDDRIHSVNLAFRREFLDGVEDPEGMDFMTAIAGSIHQGRGIKLESTTIEDFSAKVRTRRRLGPNRFAFTVDMQNGGWWLVNDYRLPNGWMLVVASEVSNLKNEEARLKEAHAEALRAAETDHLTGISNRRHGIERARAALIEFETNRLPLSIAIIDIDHFKTINDAHGHATGDAVLVVFADALRRVAAGWDQVSRLGGEEFMIIMPNTPLSRAAQRLDWFRETLKPFRAGTSSTSIVFTISAGLAAARPSEDLSALMHRADDALYLAKSRGRNQLMSSPEQKFDAA